MKRTLKIMTAVFSAVTMVVVLKNQFGHLFSGNTYGMPAAIREGEIDHLFIGSSMFRQGLNIDALESNLDGNVYILSYNGNQPVFMAEELEYLLDHGLTIDNLYVDFYAYTLAASPWISDTKMFLDTDLAFKIDAWKIMAKHNDVTFNDFYEMFVTSNNEQILMYPINNLIVSSQFRNGGSLMVLDGKSSEHLDTLDLGVRDGLLTAQLEGYEKIIALAKEHEIELRFIETPKYEKLLSDTREGSYQELLSDMITWADQSDVTYILSNTFNFDNSDGTNFQDLIHLSHKGSESYCEMLSQYLGQLL